MLQKLLSVLRQQTLGALALFVALGGTSYAVATGSIDSREIKNNTIRSNDVRDGALTGRDIGRSTLGQLRGSQGRAGPQGPRGATGLQGPKGDAGAPATRLWAQVTAAGQLAANSGAVSAQRTGNGRYTLVFNRPVEACTRVVTAGETTGVDSTWGAMAADTDTEGATVGVDLFSTAGGGAPANSSFNIAVFC